VDTPLTNVTRGYSELGTWLLQRWSAHASQVATKLDAGKYDADSAAADLAKTASLAAESWLVIAAEALDAAATLAAGPSGPYIVESEPFHTKLPGSSLRVAGPLANGFASDALAIVEPEPSQLYAGETEFHLRADATRRRAGTYRGKVVASGPGGTESVPVWVIVA
jgi:hypothetical protein